MVAMSSELLTILCSCSMLNLSIVLPAQMGISQFKGFDKKILTHGAYSPCIEVSVVVDVLHQSLPINWFWAAIGEGNLHLL